jgi:hypothetical protein
MPAPRLDPPQDNAPATTTMYSGELQARSAAFQSVVLPLFVRPGCFRSGWELRRTAAKNRPITRKTHFDFAEGAIP